MADLLAKDEIRVLRRQALRALDAALEYERATPFPYSAKMTPCAVVTSRNARMLLQVFDGYLWLVDKCNGYKEVLEQDSLMRAIDRMEFGSDAPADFGRIHEDAATLRRFVAAANPLRGPK